MHRSTARSALSALSILGLTAALTACDGQQVQSINDRIDPEVPAGHIAEVSAGNAAFAVDLLHRVGGDHDNLFYSPYSISAALGMTSAGARGETLDAIADTMHFVDQQRLHPALNRIDLDLASRAEEARGNTRPFRLNVANALWGQEDFAFHQSFLDLLAEHYGAGLRLLDFRADAEASRQTINRWVEDQTEDRIRDLLPEGSVTAATRLVLTNAIYFSAAWATPFDEAQTRPAPFNLRDGDQVDVPTMHQTTDLSYGEGEGWQAVQLPYDGFALDMTIIVPEDLAAFEAGLTGPRLQGVLDGLGHFLVDLALPKFEFTTDLPLTNPLRAMGMDVAFGDSADFSGMADAGLQITDVLHKAFVGIDESGTEAAAATAVLIGETAVPELREFAVDRPFLFVIRDRPTGMILFMGRVVDPR